MAHTFQPLEALHAISDAPAPAQLNAGSAGSLDNTAKPPIQPSTDLLVLAMLSNFSVGSAQVNSVQEGMAIVGAARTITEAPPIVKISGLGTDAATLAICQVGETPLQQAANPDTSIAALGQLARHADREVRLAVVNAIGSRIGNQSLSEENRHELTRTLAVLGTDPDIGVRVAVARNINNLIEGRFNFSERNSQLLIATQMSILTMNIPSNIDNSVMRELTNLICAGLHNRHLNQTFGNREQLIDRLMQFAADPANRCADEAARSIPGTLTSTALSDRNRRRLGLALEVLARHPSAGVRSIIGDNRHTPIHLVEMLMGDPDASVSYAARVEYYSAHRSDQRPATR